MCDTDLSTTRIRRTRCSVDCCLPIQPSIPIMCFIVAILAPFVNAPHHDGQHHQTNSRHQLHHEELPLCDAVWFGYLRFDISSFLSIVVGTRRCTGWLLWMNRLGTHGVRQDRIKLSLFLLIPVWVLSLSLSDALLWYDSTMDLHLAATSSCAFAGCARIHSIRERIQMMLSLWMWVVE